MKHIILFIVLNLNILSVFAHEINNYKFICLEVDQNPYNIEKRFQEAFINEGFNIITNEYFEEMDAKDKALTLFFDYDYWINGNGSSRLTVLLNNAAGVKVWSADGYGCTLTSNGDIRKASKQIINSFKRLRYKFKEEEISKYKIPNPYSSWTEDSIKQYLNSNKRLAIEGIYKNYYNGKSCKVAILKHENKYLGLVIDSDNNLWQKGETQLCLSHIQGNVYDAEIGVKSNDKIDALATFNNRILEFTYSGSNIDVGKFVLVKIYPTSSLEVGSSAGVTGQCRATGSGVLISDNIVVTNYHVIKDAEKVEAIINVNGIPEAFNARVLCSDKTNDLALVSIKDDRFKGQGPIPFEIVANAIDVGTSVFTMGFPLTTFLGDEVKITDGIVSSKSGYNGDIVTYQISAPIQPGNSGGALFDKGGNLVGITNAGIDTSVAENIGYAIKTPYVLNLIDSAPISIPIPKGTDMSDKDLPSLIKELKPFVVYLKIY